MRGQGAWPGPTQADPSERASRAIVGATERLLAGCPVRQSRALCPEPLQVLH